MYRFTKLTITLMIFYIFARERAAEKRLFLKKAVGCGKSKIWLYTDKCYIFLKGQRNSLRDPCVACRKRWFLGFGSARFAPSPKLRLRKRHTVAFAPLRMTRWRLF